MKKSSGRCENCGRPESEHHVFVRGVNEEKEEGDPVTCLMCGGRAEIAFRDVGNEVKVECPNCGLYDAYMADLMENEEDEYED